MHYINQANLINDFFLNKCLEFINSLNIPNSEVSMIESYKNFKFFIYIHSFNKGNVNELCILNISLQILLFCLILRTEF